MAKVLMFKEKFAQLVKTGVKRQTIRPDGGRSWYLWDRVSLKSWSGAPYRSKTVSLNEGIILACEPIEIWSRHTAPVILCGRTLTETETERLAKRDGFEDVAEFLKFFVPNDGDVFHGNLIRWIPCEQISRAVESLEWIRGGGDVEKWVSYALDGASRPVPSFDRMI